MPELSPEFYAIRATTEYKLGWFCLLSFHHVTWNYLSGKFGNHREGTGHPKENNCKYGLHSRESLLGNF